MDLVTDIKSRLSIEAVVGKYVAPLKKMGRHFKALCPFHNEKTPSFVVSPEKGLAYCFGCHRGGDIFKFTQEVERVEFSDALKILAEQAGLDPAQYRMYQPTVKKAEKDLLYDRFEKEADAYSAEVEEVCAYLHERGVNDETIRRFRIGYSRAQHRLMFPIFDERGRVCAFGGRALKEGQEPKYLNSPESPIYHKSEILYAFDRAKNAIRTQNQAIVVEGYMDAIMCHQAGFENVVACSGTAFTELQAKLLKRFCAEVILALDNDRAGFLATSRSFLVLDAEGMNVRALQIPSGKDPADTLKQDKESFTRAVAEAKPFLHFYMDRMSKTYDINTPEGARSFLRATFPFLKEMKSRLTQDFYLRECALRTRLKEQLVYDEFRASSSNAGVLSAQKEISSPTKKWIFDDYLMAMVIEFPDLLSLAQSVISADDLLPPHREYYLALPSRSDDPYFDLHALYAEEKYGEFSPENRKKEFLKIVDRICKRRYNQRCDDLRNRLKDAEIRQDRSLKEALTQELSSLLHARI